MTIIIDEQVCKACGLCMEVCPHHALGFAPHMNQRGFHPAAICDAESCTGCAQCALMCPDMCIRIIRSG